MAHPLTIHWISSNHSSTHYNCDLGHGTPAILLQALGEDKHVYLGSPCPILQHLNKVKWLVWWAKAWL